MSGTGYANVADTGNRLRRTGGLRCVAGTIPRFETIFQSAIFLKIHGLTGRISGDAPSLPLVSN